MPTGGSRELPKVTEFTLCDFDSFAVGPAELGLGNSREPPVASFLGQMSLDVE